MMEQLDKSIESFYPLSVQLLMSPAELRFLDNFQNNIQAGTVKKEEWDALEGILNKYNSKETRNEIPDAEVVYSRVQQLKSNALVGEFNIRGLDVCFRCVAPA